MSNYIKGTNFTVKDTLPTGNSSKVIRGAEIDDELTSISSAITSKADSVSPTLTGTPVAPTASSGTNTTQIATTAFVASAVSTATGALGTIATQDSDAVDITGGTIDGVTITDATITGGTISGITDLAVADGGTGLSSAGASGNVLMSNGTAWTSTPLTRDNIKELIFAASGTWTVPVGVTSALVGVYGAGSGGSGGGIYLSGNTGFPGGIGFGIVSNLTPGDTITVTVGTGGTGGNGIAWSGVGGGPTLNNGTSGGTSSFGSYITATGGGSSAGSVSFGTNAKKSLFVQTYGVSGTNGSGTEELGNALGGGYGAGGGGGAGGCSINGSSNPFPAGTGGYDTFTRYKAGDGAAGTSSYSGGGGGGSSLVAAGSNGSGVTGGAGASGAGTGGNGTSSSTYRSGGGGGGAAGGVIIYYWS